MSNKIQDLKLQLQSKQKELNELIVGNSYIIKPKDWKLSKHLRLKVIDDKIKDCIKQTIETIGKKKHKKYKFVSSSVIICFDKPPCFNEGAWQCATICDMILKQLPNKYS